MSTPNHPNDAARLSGEDVTPRGQSSEAGAVGQQPTEAIHNVPGQAQEKGPGQPPWKQEPQTNLQRPGTAPVVGRPASGGNGVPSRGRTPSEVERAAQKQVNRTKAAVIDGPTRNLARPQLNKDMPDLSAARHPGSVDPDLPMYTPARGSASVAAAATPDPLRATVQLRRIDPWTTLQVSLVISAALFLVWMVAVGLLYGVLDGMGVWERLNNAFTDIVSDGSSDGLISAGQVFGYAAVIGLINAVLLTALATIGSFIYNQCTDLVGGIQVTLADPD
ncbi:DUF3566 domain-containing protein [Aldersonia kunmingensis]|uniref:DUF3566 domain-containing protein n=1 Tax=Aldersonia kunmingensis TaxID=408066 RepID=UPI000A51470E|nr:DUF3566 domain-containing protein [Aldersonia kunmingensis]